jgi:hypothetical protein
MYRRFPNKNIFPVTVVNFREQALIPIAIFPPSPVFTYSQLFFKFSRFFSFDNVAAAVLKDQTTTHRK